MPAMQARDVARHTVPSLDVGTNAVCSAAAAAAAQAAIDVHEGEMRAMDSKLDAIADVVEEVARVRAILAMIYLKFSACTTYRALLRLLCLQLRAQLGVLTAATSVSACETNCTDHASRMLFLRLVVLAAACPVGGANSVHC
jgi:thioredoxin-like negative regulator of GroEL